MHLQLSPEHATARYRDRFWAKVAIGPPDECWEWTRSRHSSGYGRVGWPDGKNRNASRVAYALTYGDPGDLHVCHHCDNPPCCNPTHLFAGTGAENTADMVAKGRYINGARKLTADDVIAIRAAIAEGETQRSVGARFGISHAQVGTIVHRKQWSHIP